jgi:hypothetical protein
VRSIADNKATEAYEAEVKKVESARAALPDVETLLSLDELQASPLSLSLGIEADL